MVGFFFWKRRDMELRMSIWESSINICHIWIFYKIRRYKIRKPCLSGNYEDKIRQSGNSGIVPDRILKLCPLLNARSQLFHPVPFLQGHAPSLQGQWSAWGKGISWFNGSRRGLGGKQSRLEHQVLPPSLCLPLSKPLNPTNHSEIRKLN